MTADGTHPARRPSCGRRRAGVPIGFRLGAVRARNAARGGPATPPQRRRLRRSRS